MYNFPQHANDLGYQRALKFVQEAHSSHILLGSVSHTFCLESARCEDFSNLCAFCLCFQNSAESTSLAHLYSKLDFKKKIKFCVYYSVPLFFRNLTHLFKYTQIMIRIVTVFYSTLVTQ